MELFKGFTVLMLSKRDLETLQYDGFDNKEFKSIQELWKTDLKYHVHWKATYDDWIIHVQKCQF